MVGDVSVASAFCDGDLGEPEVEHLDRAAGRDLDVGGLQIAMDDTLGVRGLERVHDLARDAEGLLERNRAGLDAVRERRALDQLHHQGAIFDSVYRGDVGVVQRGQHLRLAREARHLYGIGCQAVREKLHGDLSSELRVGRPVHFAHSAFAQLLHDSIMGEGFADHERVLCRATARPRRSSRPALHARTEAGPP
jgi:hypothetical protein